MHSERTESTLSTHKTHIWVETSMCRSLFPISFGIFEILPNFGGKKKERGNWGVIFLWGAESMLTSSYRHTSCCLTAEWPERGSMSQPLLSSSGAGSLTLRQIITLWITSLSKLRGKKEIAIQKAALCLKEAVAWCTTSPQFLYSLGIVFLKKIQDTST